MSALRSFQFVVKLLVSGGAFFLLLPSIAYDVPAFVIGPLYISSVIL